MKKVIVTLFTLLITVGVFAQEKFDGSEFNTMTPEENAKAYTAYLTKTYKLSDAQATKIHDIRLKSAQHVQMLDQAVANGESRNGYEAKRTKIIEVGVNRVLNLFTYDQMKVYKNRKNKLKEDAARKARGLKN